MTAHFGGKLYILLLSRSGVAAKDKVGFLSYVKLDLSCPSQNLSRYTAGALYRDENDHSDGYESGDILVSETEGEDNDIFTNEAEAEDGDIESQSEPEDSEENDLEVIEVFHKHKKSRISKAPDDITPSRSTSSIRRVLPASDPTHKKSKGHTRSASRSRKGVRVGTSNESIASALTEVTNTLIKVVKRLDKQEKVLKKITSSASASSSSSSESKEMLIRVS